MPGPILLAKCACGFERDLSPGTQLRSPNDLRVIAYTADERDLVTVDNEEAQKLHLTVIEDPYIKAETGEPWGPYRCPGCGQRSLQLCHTGFWD
jgi:hypothetical protein